MISKFEDSNQNSMSLNKKITLKIKTQLTILSLP